MNVFSKIYQKITNYFNGKPQNKREYVESSELEEIDLLPKKDEKSVKPKRRQPTKTKKANAN